MPGPGDFKIMTPYGKKWASYLCCAMDCQCVHDDLVAALQRALFVLESPTIHQLTNGAGTVDFVRAALARANKKTGVAAQPARA